MLLAPASGRAQPVSTPYGVGPPVWLTVHLGASIPQRDDLDGVNPGYDFGARLGGRFSRHVGIELGVGYTHADGTDSSGVKRSVSDVPIEANLRLRAPYRSFEFSAAAGVGLHFAGASVEPPASTGAPTIPHDSIAFGFQVGVAADFHLTPSMLVGVQVQRSGR